MKPPRFVASYVRQRRRASTLTWDQRNRTGGGDQGVDHGRSVAINDGDTPTWRTVVADILMLGMLGLIAVVAGDLFSLTNQKTRVFVGALAALLSARLIKTVRDKAGKRAEQIADDYLGRSGRQTLTQVYAEPLREVPPDMTRTLGAIEDEI